MQNSVKNIQLSDAVFISAEVILTMVAIVFEINKWSLTPIIIPMIAIAIHFSWKAAHPSETHGKIQSVLDILEGGFGQGISEEKMLKFYDELKYGAEEFSVVWCLKFNDETKRIDEYLESEKKLVKNKKMKVRRLIHQGMGIVPKLEKHAKELESENESYQQLLNYQNQNMEIGFSKYRDPKKENLLSSRGIIILGNNEQHPKIGFYFDDGINPKHANIISAISQMFEKQWKECKDAAI